MSVLWSSGPSSFEPLIFEGDALARLDASAQRARQALAAAVRSGSGDELPELGRDLYRQFFASPVGVEIAVWLRGLGDVDSLEILTDAPGRIPYALFEDPARPGAWGLRYPLAAGRRANPLRMFAQFDSPTVTVAIDDAVLGELPPETRALFDAFVAQAHVRLVGSRRHLDETLDVNVPDVLWIVGRSTASGWSLSGETLTPTHLAERIRNAKMGNALPVVIAAFLDGSTAETSLSAEIPGLVTFETPVAAGTACDIGLSLLREFLVERQPLAQAVRSIRQTAGPAGLALAAYAPAKVRVLKDGDVDAEAGPPSRPLPQEPFHPFRPLEREERALLFGRDDDIARCAAQLDHAESPGVVIHGRGGVGKASLVRAGLLPFLEEENGGWYALRDRTEPADDELDQPTIALRPGFDLAGSLCQGLVAFAARPFTYTTPTQRTVTVDLPGIVRAFARQADTVPTTEIAPGTPPESPSAEQPAAPAPDEALDVGKLCLAADGDFGAFADLLDRLTRDLPFELIVPIEHLDDIVAQHDRPPVASIRVASDVLSSLARSPGRFRTLATARTEFYGRIPLPASEPGSPAFRDYYLDDLSASALEEVLVAPASPEPLLYGAGVPAERYSYAIDAASTAAAIALVRQNAARTGDSAIATAQALGRLLTSNRQSAAGQIGMKDLTRFSRDGVSPIDSLAESTINSLPVPPVARKSLRSWLPTLSRTVGGVVVGRLVPESSARQVATGRTSVEQTINAAVERGPLLDVQPLIEGGREKTYITPAQHAFARFAGGRGSSASAKSSTAWWDVGSLLLKDALWLVIPLAVLGMAITYYLSRRSATQDTAEIVAEAKNSFKEQLDKTLNATRLTSYPAMLAEAEGAIRQGNTLKARQLLLSQQSTRTADIRGFEWYGLWNQIKGPDRAFRGHKTPVTTLAMSTDGKWVASADMAGAVLLWRTGQAAPLVAALRGATGPVVSLAFSPGNERIAAADGSDRVMVWEAVKLGKDVVAVEPTTFLSGGGKSALSVAFVGADTLAVGYADKTVASFDVAGEKINWKAEEHDGPVIALFAVDGKTLVSASRRQVVSWTANGHKAASATLNEIEAASLAASKKQGQVVILGNRSPEGDRGAIAVWDLAKDPTPVETAATAIVAAGYLAKYDRYVTAGPSQAVLVRTLTGRPENDRLLGHLSSVRAVAAGGDLFVSAGQDGVIRVWDARTTTVRDKVEMAASITALAFPPSEAFLASADRGKTIAFWNPATGAKIGEIETPGPAAKLSFSSTGSRLAAAIGNEAHVWDITSENGKVSGKSFGKTVTSKERITAIRFGTDAQSIVTGDAGGEVAIWSLEDGTKSKTMSTDLPVRTLDYSDNVVVVGDAGGKVHLFDTKTGKLKMMRGKIHDGPIEGLVTVDTSKEVVAVSIGGDHSVKTWIAGSAEAPYALIEDYRTDHGPGASLVFTRNYFITAGADGSVVFWNPKIAEPRFTLNVGSPVRALALAQRTAILAIGDDAGGILFFRSSPPAKDER